ncbi:MAG: tyrosine--tRNA ligase [Myxococcales bacterium]|nr:tyrosine--tRNA ligase [Myxococcales bacterium]
MKSAKEQLQEIKRGIVELHVENELLQKLERSVKTGKPLRVKAGFDPTAPDLHIGHTVLMSVMRRFQDLGHTAIFLVGDFTAQIGDPTGKKSTRPLLSPEEIKANAQTYIEQVMKILDPARTEVRYNSEWMNKLDSVGMIRLAAQSTVQQMLTRNDFNQRKESNTPIAVHEFLYPLVQAYDSVVLEADVELGGTDQLFNLMLGRQIQKAYNQESQIVITTPLLEGTDGRLVDGKLVGEKMSKSLGNYIGVNEANTDIFGKMMSISDALMWRYYELLSQRSFEEVQQLRQAVESGQHHPMDAKRQLAREIVTRFHGQDAAVEAEEHFQRTVVNKEDPDEMPTVTLPFEGEPFSLFVALQKAGLAPSSSQARRLIQQGAVTLDGEKADNPQLPLGIGEYTLKSGKRNFCRLVIQ